MTFLTLTEEFSTIGNQLSQIADSVTSAIQSINLTIGQGAASSQQVADAAGITAHELEQVHQLMVGLSQYAERLAEGVAKFKV